jgi:predicted DsbA family dithiol-disulfide isomerase
VPKLRVDIWADISCPWCYVGKRHLEQALDRFPNRDAVEVVWRSFEQEPLAPRIASESYVEQLARSCRTQLPQAQAMIDRIVDTAAQSGVELRFDRIRGGNTFDAHRLLHFARERGMQHALEDRLRRAYHAEGHAIGDRDVLAALASEAGLDDAEVREVLASDRYTDEVRRDESCARELGITGVPYFVVAGRIGMSGAQPADVLLGALEWGWAELRLPEPEVAPGTTPEAMSDAMPEDMPEAMSGAVPGAMPEAMSDAMPGAMPEAMLAAMIEAMPEAMTRQ